MGNDNAKGGSGSTITTNQELIEKRMQLMSSNLSTYDILSKLRSGKKDYDYGTKKSIGVGGQAEVFEIKSNIDSKLYAAKILTLPAQHLMNREETVRTC